MLMLRFQLLLSPVRLYRNILTVLETYVKFKVSLLILHDKVSVEMRLFTSKVGHGLQLARSLVPRDVKCPIALGPWICDGLLTEFPQTHRLAIILAQRTAPAPIPSSRESEGCR